MKTDEDERDDEISEPTQVTRTDKRKEIHTDRTAKELRAPLSVAASSHASSWRFSVETQEQLVRSSKQARTAKKGVEKLQDVSNLFHYGHCEHQRQEKQDLWAHERTPDIPRNVDDLETTEFAHVLGAIAEDQHFIRCAQACSAGTEEDQAERGSS